MSTTPLTYSELEKELIEKFSRQFVERFGVDGHTRLYPYPFPTVESFLHEDLRPLIQKALESCVVGERRSKRHWNVTMNPVSMLAKGTAIGHNEARNDQLRRIKEFMEQ